MNELIKVPFLPFFYVWNSLHRYFPYHLKLKKIFLRALSWPAKSVRIAKGLINKSLPFQRQDLQWAGFSISNKQHQFDHSLTIQIVLHQKLRDGALLSGHWVIQYHTIIHRVYFLEPLLLLILLGPRNRS